MAEGGESSESGEPVGHRYRRFELIGSGAMGAVYRGEDREGRDLAVKILRSEFSSDSLILSRFMQERALMVRLAGDGIVKVVDFVAEGEMLAIVMERIAGGSLRDLMARDRQSISQSMAIRLLADVAAGLATAHAAGVIHRDIKPENVLIDDAGERPVALVTDFGISGLTEGSAHTRMTSLVGTPQYMAPELINGDVASPAVDVYAAGIMLYELLAGKTPFAGG
ncbi:MAG: serine/threonine-protein kinase, partial [Actinomycetes bacterium]